MEIDYNTLGDEEPRFGKYGEEWDEDDEDSVLSSQDDDVDAILAEELSDDDDLPF